VASAVGIGCGTGGGEAEADVTVGASVDAETGLDAADAFALASAFCCFFAR
jgi:hypothetical protein